MEKMCQCLTYVQELVKNKGMDKRSSDSEDESVPKFPKVNLKKLDIDADLLDNVLGTIYGNCIGDAIGLITEFLDKRQVRNVSTSI